MASGCKDKRRQLEDDKVDCDGNIAYYSKLNDIGKDLGEADLDALKFLCADVIPLSRRESVSSPNDLFSELKKSGQLSQQNGHFLLECLMHIHRPDLLERLGYNMKELEALLQTDNKVSKFRSLLYKLTEELLEEDLQMIINVYSCRVKRLKKVTTIYSAFIVLEQERVIHTGDTSSLVDVFKAIERMDLIDRVKNTKNQGFAPIQKDSLQRPWDLNVQPGPSGDQANSASTNTPENNFKSRFEEEFEVLEILGCGGFGVVFKAYKRLDEQEYAVKRMAVSSLSESAIKKVKKEAIAYALLEHKYIVRYYNSWIETPPPGVQESKDEAMKISFSEAPSTLGASSKGSRTNESSYRGEDGNKDSSDSGGIVFGETNAGGDVSNVGHFENRSSWDYANSSNNDDYKSLCKGVDKMGPLNNDYTDSSISYDESSQENMPVKERKPKLYIYIQMQLCKKDTLKEWLENAPASERRIDRILSKFKQILSAVHYIHQKSMIHRDLKPSNIFFSSEGVIKLGDFGLSQTLLQEGEGEPSGTRDRQLTSGVGTRPYMSPEQIERKSYTEKVDIYALGLIFFEMSYNFSTGFERVQWWDKVRNCEFPNSFKGNIHMYPLVKKMLAKDPEDRPSTRSARESLDSIKISQKIRSGPKLSQS